MTVVRALGIDKKLEALEAITRGDTSIERFNALDEPTNHLCTTTSPRPGIDTQAMKLDFSASGLHDGKVLVTAEGINFGYTDARPLWSSPLDFQIKSGERWVIRGDNGSGKTTLLKLVTEQLAPRSGLLTRADFSYTYIDQEYSIISDPLMVYEQAQTFNTRHFQEHEIKMLLRCC